MTLKYENITAILYCFLLRISCFFFLTKQIKNYNIFHFCILHLNISVFLQVILLFAPNFDNLRFYTNQSEIVERLGLL